MHLLRKWVSKKQRQALFIKNIMLDPNSLKENTVSSSSNTNDSTNTDTNVGEQNTGS